MAEMNNGHMERHRQNDWGSVHYDARFDEYWVPAGEARQLLFHCPWCGERLPASQRDRWFDELEAQGIDPVADPIPTEFQTGEWRGASEPDNRARERGGPIDGRVLNLFDLETDED